MPFDRFEEIPWRGSAGRAGLLGPPHLSYGKAGPAGPPYPRSGLRPLLSALCLLLSGCLRNESNVQQGNREQVLHRGIGSEPGDLDPHFATNIVEFDLDSALFEGLVAEDPVDLHPVPGVAATWTPSQDQLTYTFHFRADARWSNGEPVTAQDFVASWRRILTPSLAAANASMLYVIRGAEAFHKGRTSDFSQVGVSAPDARTLLVTLERPTPYFLTLLSQPAWMPVPMATIAANGSTTERGNAWTRPEHLVGNGPFRLKSWEPNRQIVMEKSPTYWDAAKVRLKAIHFYPIDSVDTEERAFRTGQLHLTYGLPSGKAEVYRRDAPQFLRTDTYLDTFFLRFNIARPFLNDPRVRRALALAVERTAIVEKVLKGGQQPAFALTPPGLAGYTPPAAAPTDFEAARRLLVDAGYAGGRGLPVFELLTNTSENHRVLSETIQATWKRELGLEVRLANQEFRVVLANRRAGQYEILLSDWVGDYLDPTTFLDLWRSDSGNNHTGWSSRDYDALMNQAAQTTEPAARNVLLGRAESLMLEAAPIAPLYYHTHNFLIQPSVKGWNPTLLDHHPYKSVWLEIGN